MTETSRFSEGDESIADFSERPGFGVAPSPSRSHLTSVGPTTFAAAFAQAVSTPLSPGKKIITSLQSNKGHSYLFLFTVRRMILL
jgi:hypothetical protein